MSYSQTPICTYYLKRTEFFDNFTILSVSFHAVVIKPPLDCYRLNSKRTSLVTQCTANYFGSCYHLIRKSSTGDVLYEVYGCADECVEEKRNRAVKTCCNTTLCNIVKDGPDNPSAPSTATEPSQFVSPTAVLNLLSVTASVELLSSSVQLLAPEGQGWTITEVKTTSTSIMSTNLNPSTKSRSHPASMETTTSTSELTCKYTTLMISYICTISIMCYTMIIEVCVHMYGTPVLVHLYIFTYVHIYF